MFEKLNFCPVCDHNSHKKFITCNDYSISKENFYIVECIACGFKFTNPRPTPTSIDKYYESEEYISHTNKGNSIINILYKIVRNITLKNKLNLINNKSIKGKILDIGCGTGEFIKVCKNDGWKISGVEPGTKARQAAIKTTGVNILPTIYEIDTTLKFEAITLWHVLEHIPNLNEYISFIKNLLIDNGKLIVAVPNANSFDATYFKENWAAYDVPRHFYHFTPETIKNLFHKHNLKIESIYPLKFDPYYISLLSTKYQKGKSSYLKSIKIGFESNKWAKNNNNNYSSLTYVIKK